MGAGGALSEISAIIRPTIEAPLVTVNFRESFFHALWWIVLREQDGSLAKTQPALLAND